jgi:hypothetical protein
MLVDQHTRALLTAIVQEPAAHNQQDIADLVQEIADWDALLDIARAHRLLPLLISRVNGMEKAIPPEAQKRLRAEYDSNAFHTLANASELVALLQAFDEQNIPAMPFKGLVLSASVYRNPALRSAGDLDFLVFEQDLQRATAVLLKKGYELKTKVFEDGTPAIPGLFEFHFERGTDGMVAELRWKLELLDSRYPGWFLRDLGMDWVWPQRRTVNVAGVDVPNLDPVSNLLILCMHGAKHRWSRMIWVYDVAQLLEGCPDLDWKEVTREARRRGLWRALALGVLLAHDICGVNVPEKTLERFASDRAAREMAGSFQRMILKEPGQLPPGPMPYSLRILDLGDRIRWLARMGFLRPNERDLAVVRLPNVLYPLYFLVRPFRVLFDRSAR